MLCHHDVVVFHPCLVYDFSIQLINISLKMSAPAFLFSSSVVLLNWLSWSQNTTVLLANPIILVVVGINILHYGTLLVFCVPIHQWGWYHNNWIVVVVIVVVMVVMVVAAAFCSIGDSLVPEGSCAPYKNYF